jgi:hypothetical protein
MTEITKYQSSISIEVLRSTINFANYNPRKISDFASTQIRKNIRRVGLLGGIVLNKPSMNIVSEHQRIKQIDTLQGYNTETFENDYLIRVEMIDVDEKTEIEQNIFMNSQSVQGEFDIDLLKDLIPDIDYKAAGLDDTDLNMIGIELFKDTVEKGVTDLENSINEVMKPVEDRKEHIKELKKQIVADANAKVDNFDSYITLNFQTSDQKRSFMQRFGFSPDEKFIDGNAFAETIERIL